MESALLAGSPVALTQPQALTGLGGIGKTQVAVEFYYRHRNRYQHVFWVGCDTDSERRTGFVDIWRRVTDRTMDPKDEEGNIARAKHWLTENNDWLLILDNADDPPAIKSYLPPKGKGHVLITSRRRDWGGMAETMEIKRLSEEEGGRLLLRRAGLSEEPVSAEAKAFSKTVGGLALALDQAGAYMEANGVSVAEYQELYAEAGHDLREHRPGDSPTEHDTVAVTYALAHRKIAEANPAAAELLTYAALLAPEAIPETIFVQGAEAFGEPLQSVATNKLQWREAVGILYRYSLIERDAEAGTFSMHRVLQEVICDNIAEQRRRDLVERLVNAVNQATPSIKFSNWNECARLLPHWMVCCRYGEEYALHDLTMTRLLNQVAFYLVERAAYTDALPLFERALQICENVFGGMHPDTATSLNNLASLYQFQGRLLDALPLLERAVVIYESTLGEMHPETAGSLNNLGYLCQQQGRLSDALPLYERALAIRESALGEGHPDTAASLNNLAELYRQHGRLLDALPLYERALAIRESALGEIHPDTAQSLNNLGYLYQSLGRYTDALPLLERALAIRESALGEGHPDTAASLNNLAVLYRQHGRLLDALPLCERALAIRESALGEIHPDTAQSLNNLGYLYRQQGHLSDALPLFERALAILKASLGEYHPNTRIVQRNLAILRTKMQQG